MNLFLNKFKFVIGSNIIMKSSELRDKFIKFFQAKGHAFIPSSPIVIKNDPTLLFVNAGMNQFKDVFLSNIKPVNTKVTNSQKCLRVSGKHNDLEEVGHDTYHHTMFEMLGNWSFGDYFKKEAIHFAWDFLTKELGLSQDRLYVTFFQGDEEEKMFPDNETQKIWSNILSADKIIEGTKQDNFWEMGKIGPCGPSTEIHIDLRTDSERNKEAAKLLINQDHPQVIEIWNIVFIEFNRKSDGLLDLLPQKHVDTGMGFERLCMVLQNKTSTYDTDIFLGLIKTVSSISKFNYGDDPKTDIAIRVIVDHLRAIAFSIADGQLPSNTGAGYVIRRILRRAVRYGYTYLNLKEPFLYQLVEGLSVQFQNIFPEIHSQSSSIQDVIKQEEDSFFKTLGKGLQLIKKSIDLLSKNQKVISGSDVFDLYDTYGFPPDLTSLILKEKGLSYNKFQFDQEMSEQKNRSRYAAEIILGDWVEVNNIQSEDFEGYDCFVINDARIIKYRKNTLKDKTQYNIIFNKTPFYPEGGGQVGDSGYAISINDKSDSQIVVVDTKKENNSIIHVVDSLPKDLNINGIFSLYIDSEKRQLVTRNHSATHILHYVLRLMLGEHVEQKGSYVGANYLRFDFSHFQKIEQAKIVDLENKINSIITQGTMLEEFRGIAMAKAQEMGALALFGEKYGNTVRVIKFNDSIELCGGTHVKSTSEIGLLKIISESSVASGIRRIEAVTSKAAISLLNNYMFDLEKIKSLLKASANIPELVQKLIYENKKLIKLEKEVQKNKSSLLIHSLESQISGFKDLKLLFSELETDVSSMKNICFSFIEKYDNICLALAIKQENKVIVNIALSKKITHSKNLDASEILQQLVKCINGRGGGQPFFAVASGNDLNGLNSLFDNFVKIITSS